MIDMYHYVYRFFLLLRGDLFIDNTGTRHFIQDCFLTNTKGKIIKTNERSAWPLGDKSTHDVNAFLLKYGNFKSEEIINDGKRT